MIHSEKAGKAFAEKGGRFQGVQLWINLPKSEKMQTPSYQPLTTDEIVLIKKDKAELRLVSGSYDGRKGPAKSNVFTAMLRMCPPDRSRKSIALYYYTAQKPEGEIDPHITLFLDTEKVEH